ncbi:hypothetical protein OGM63_21390 [Plectonema radiosum NIES-515]|uniref:Uncharacterized protein n=1 Tax=Plectonema radiosum NIES-515 TaxID=2986073 RepID=A0ABT3B3U4_9CYAN|nr:hypothetical protein [Plectonema radiosum]MCV3216032.1 hypothetical protein [Plectonema radiosum NIES-515]
MPTASLGRIYFPITRKTGADAGRSNPDPSGVFSCNMNAARFLDINDKAIALPVMVRERKAGKRSITLADGTTITATQAGTEIATTEIVLPVSGRGSRTVILKTGKLIADSQRLKGKTTAYHTISFRFPSFVTVLGICEALGELIPASKIKNPPTATDVWGHFTIKGGRRYPIMLGTDAETSTDYSVSETAAEMAALVVQGAAKKMRQAAGGEAPG